MFIKQKTHEDGIHKKIYFSHSQIVHSFIQDNKCNSECTCEWLFFLDILKHLAVTGYLQRKTEDLPFNLSTN